MVLLGIVFSLCLKICRVQLDVYHLKIILNWWRVHAPQVVGVISLKELAVKITWVATHI